MLVTSAAFSALDQLHVGSGRGRQAREMNILVGYNMWSRVKCSFVDSFERLFRSPFTQLEQARERHLGAVIESIGVAYQIPDAEPLIDRLQTLRSYWIEEHSPDEHLSVDALIGLLTFLSAHTALKLPEITTTAAGTWAAQWRRDADHNVNVHFVDATMARYSIFSREPRAKPGEAQAWGSIEIAGLFDVAKGYRAEKWMTREG